MNIENADLTVCKAAYAKLREEFDLGQEKLAEMVRREAKLREALSEFVRSFNYSAHNHGGSDLRLWEQAQAALAPDAGADKPQAVHPSGYRYELWKHLHDEYGLTLLESELDDIVAVVARLDRLLTREQVRPLVWHWRDVLRHPDAAHTTLVEHATKALTHARSLGFEI